MNGQQLYQLVNNFIKFIKSLTTVYINNSGTSLMVQWLRLHATNAGGPGSLEKEMATHYSVLAWRIPGTGQPGGLPSMGSHRVRHD